jgi:hypothetical protein
MALFLMKLRDGFVFTILVNGTVAGGNGKVRNFADNRGSGSAAEWKLKQPEETVAIEGPFVEIVWPRQSPVCW